jgi:hypothetical protein
MVFVRVMLAVCVDVYSGRVAVGNGSLALWQTWGKLLPP